MPGAVEYGKCDVCGKHGPVMRTYYSYDIKCECHSPTHAELVIHCSTCEPKEPTYTKIHFKTSDLKKIMWN